MKPTFTPANLTELNYQLARTESMDDAERQQWTELLPSMSDDQKLRLLDILVTEDTKLQELEASYQADMKAMSSPHLIDWNNFELNTIRNVR